MLMLDLMIIPFHRKLVKFSWIGVINWLKNFFSWIWKSVIMFLTFNKQELLHKGKGKYHNCGNKEKVSVYIKKKKQKREMKR